MKTKEELNALKEEVEALNNKLAELTEDELKLVTDGVVDLNVPEPLLVKPAQTLSKYKTRKYECGTLEFSSTCPNTAIFRMLKEDNCHCSNCPINPDKK